MNFLLSVLSRKGTGYENQSSCLYFKEVGRVKYQQMGYEKTFRM